VRVEAVRSNLHFITHNFLSIDGGPVTVTNLIGRQVPSGSTVSVWDPVAQAYRPESINILGNWSPGTNRIFPGRGFWLRIAGTAPSNAYQVYLMGEVPDKTTLPTNTTPILSGLNMVAFPYPTTIPWTNTAIAKALPSGSTASFWNPTTQSYIPAAKNIIGAWSPNNIQINPGQAVWIRSAIATNWVEVKPYTWP